MKKLILLLMMWLAAAGMTATADQLHVSGYVTDSANGNALNLYPVHIDIDSATGGFVFHHTVFTNANGYYADTVVFNGGALSGVVTVSVWDCRQILHMENFYFHPGVLNFTHNFAICYGTPPPPCHADFYPTAAPPPPNPLNLYFVNTSVGANGPWHWDFGDGSTSTLFDPIHLFAAPGVYNVTLMMGDSSAGCFDMRTHAIQVGDSTGGCHAQFTWTCDSNTMMKTVHFFDLSTPAPVAWLWNFGDSASGTTNISTIQNPTHVFTLDGDYHVCLTITTSTKCTSTECHEVHIGPPPPPPCNSWFTHMNNFLHVNFEGHMAGNVPASYSWAFGDGTADTGRLVQHNYAAAGNYEVHLTTVTLDTNQCTFTSMQHIFVGDTMNLHQVYGQVFAGNFPMEHGLAMIFSDDTVAGGMPFFAMSPLDSAGVYMFPYVPSGQFVIWALPFDSVGGYLPTFYLHSLFWEQATKITLGNAQNPYNISLIHATNGPNGPGGINGHVNMQGLKTATPDQIAMILTDEQGNPIGFRRVSANGTFDFSNMAYGTYFLKPELANTTSDLVKVILSAANPIPVVNMTYNGKTILGIGEVSAVESFTAYPNPAKDALNLNIKMVSSANASIEIYSFTGQKVLSQNLVLAKGANTVSLDMSLMNSGLYTLRITSAEGIRIIQKIVKE
ncbi:MAG: PKD domain-containing protein [Bacteroidota bacterium]